MKIIKITLNGSYPLTIASDLLTNNTIAEFCATLGNRLVVIADDQVAELYGESLLNNFRQKDLEVNLLTFPHGEQNKTRATKELIEDKMLQLGCGRDTCIVALGGGVTTDLAGFIAATYCRGIPFVSVPTTLLAMIDASVGGKTAVNTSWGKNLIGAFYQPNAVFIDPKTLITLPEKEFNNGMVEIIKHALIASRKEFEFIKVNKDKIINKQSKIIEKLIANSCLIKKDVVEQDEKDVGIRHLLNFGHTIGHALERASQYRMLHGEAVALGIIAESYMSLRMGLLPENTFATIKDIFCDYEISIQLNMEYKKDEIEKALQMDKKNINLIPRFVLIEGIGKPHLMGKNHVFEVLDNIISDAIDFIICGNYLC